MVFPHAGGIDQAKNAVLAAAHDPSGLRQQDRPARAEVEATLAEGTLIIGGEVVTDPKPGQSPQLTQAVPVPSSASIGIKAAVARHEIDVGGIGDKTLPPLPDGCFTAVGRRIEHGRLL